MRWKFKAHAMAVASRLPFGQRCYSLAQRCCGTNCLDVDESIARALEIVKLIREGGGGIRGEVLEIGTGWRPFVPFVLHLAGAGRILTLDIHPWLSEAYAFETSRTIESEISRIAKELELEEGAVTQRYRSATQGARTLAELLRGFGVEYHCPGDARQTGLSDASVDVVCSSNVLEHVPPEVLERIHKESMRILKPGGLAVHRFNPQDHFAAIDRSITGANFLRYSKRQWYWLGGSGLSYHNRLRCVEHKRLFEQVGFITAVEQVRVDTRVVTAIETGRLSVHPDFTCYSPGELAADYMWYVGRRPT
jgi:SAM-dependent methyltransferase